MVYKSGQIFLPFCHDIRVWQTDGRTDRRTDGQTKFSSQYRVCITCSAVKTFLHYRVKHKSLKMLQLRYQFSMTKLCRTFMITLWTVNRFEKNTHSTNLEHCFTASMIAHSISSVRISRVSQLKMSFSGTQTRRRALRSSLLLRYQLNSVEGGANVQLFLNIVNLWLMQALVDRAVYK